MINWEDEGIILKVTAFGETAAVVSIFTEKNGKHAGLVRGAKTQAMRSLLQIGNKVKATWRARLSEHLGTFKLEPIKSIASNFFDDPLKLLGLTSAVAIVDQALPDREPAVEVWHGLLALLDTITDYDEYIWLAAYIRWEIGFLGETGFKLGLDKCVVTGDVEDLSFVSPKSGCAVSDVAGEQYRDKLLPLPSFLTAKGFKAPKEFLEGLQLTEYFFKRHVFGVYNKPLPSPRQRLFQRVEMLHAD